MAENWLLSSGSFAKLHYFALLILLPPSSANGGDKEGREIEGGRGRVKKGCRGTKEEERTIEGK